MINIIGNVHVLNEFLLNLFSCGCITATLPAIQPQHYILNTFLQHFNLYCGCTSAIQRLYWQPQHKIVYKGSDYNLNTSATFYCCYKQMHWLFSPTSSCPSQCSLNFSSVLYPLSQVSQKNALFSAKSLLFTFTFWNH